jgi:hypothetical protein
MFQVLWRGLGRKLAVETASVGKDLGHKVSFL